MEWHRSSTVSSALEPVTMCSVHLRYPFRMDKYYMLIRRFVNASFRFLAREQWNQDVCDRYNEILSQQGGPLWCVHMLLIV